MKYIIDIPDEHESDYIAETPFGKRLFFPLRITDVTYSLPTHLHVEEYTEPDRKAIEDEVWEFVRDYTNMNCSEHEKAYENYDWWDVFNCLSYQEAKAKYDEWKKQKEEIHIGDEVKPKTSQRKGTVISEGTDYVRVLFEDVDYPFISAWEKKNVIKTGRHFDEVERLLERMREQK